MSALTAVRCVLQSSPAITSLVGSRIYPVEAVQDMPMPQIVIHLVNEVDGRHLLGSNRYPVCRFICDCLAEEYNDADQLGDTIDFALIDYRGTVVGYKIDDIGHDDIDEFDRGETGRIWRRRLGFLMRYRVLEPVDEDSPPGP